MHIDRREDDAMGHRHRAAVAVYCVFMIDTLPSRSSHQWERFMGCIVRMQRSNWMSQRGRHSGATVGDVPSQGRGQDKGSGIRDHRWAGITRRGHGMRRRYCSQITSRIVSLRGVPPQAEGGGRSHGTLSAPYGACAPYPANPTRKPVNRSTVFFLSLRLRTHVMIRHVSWKNVFLRFYVIVPSFKNQTYSYSLVLEILTRHTIRFFSHRCSPCQSVFSVPIGVGHFHRKVSLDINGREGGYTR